MTEDKGGKFLMPKTPILGVGLFAACHDTEVNAFGIVEEEEDSTTK
jgi:predicted enzyme related to lactoylglutathione lyase